MSSGSSRRTSAASTASSMPRTPSSARWARDELHWRDSGHIQLGGAFNHSDYASEESSTMSMTPITPLSHGHEQHTSFKHLGAEHPGWSRSLSTTIAPRDLEEPGFMASRVARSATFHSGFHHSSGSATASIRPWPKPPNKTNSMMIESSCSHGASPLRHERFSSMSEISRMSLDEDITDDDEGDDEGDGDGTGPFTESDDNGNLRRRQHIRRPTREKLKLPRPLPPLPNGNLAHSQSTSGRFISTPITRGGDEPYDDHSLASTALPHNPVRRAHTFNALSGSFRPLPTITASATTPTEEEKNVNSDEDQMGGRTPLAASSSSSVPAAIVPAGAPKERNANKKQSSALQLKLSTLQLRSNPSEAAAVLTKTPNRRFNPLGNIFGDSAPPMPADASSRIDWSLIGDALEVDGELGDYAPSPLPDD